MRTEKKNKDNAIMAPRGFVFLLLGIFLFCAFLANPIKLLAAAPTDAAESFSPAQYVTLWPFEALDSPWEELRVEAVGQIFSSCKEAVASFRRLETETEDQYGLEDPRTLGIKIRLTYSYNQCGDLKEAIDLGADISDLAEKVLGADSLEYILLENRLADSYGKSGNLLLSRDNLIKTMIALEKKFGPEDIAVMNAREDLAYAFFQLKDYSHARHIYSRLVEIRERKFGANDEKTFELKANLGVVDFYLGHKDLGLKITNEALDTAVRTLGKDSLTVKRIEDRLNAITMNTESGDKN